MDPNDNPDILSTDGAEKIARQIGEKTATRWPSPIFLYGVGLFILLLAAVSAYRSLISRQPETQQIIPDRLPTIPPRSPTQLPPSVIGNGDVASWSTYQNQKFGFSFKYPSTRFPYITKEIEDDEDLIFYIAPTREGDANYGEDDSWISVGVRSYREDMTLDEYLNLDGNQEFYRDTTREQLEIGGKQGYKIRHDPSGIEAHPVFSYTQLVKRGRYIYVIELVAITEKILIDNEDIFDQILSTFRLLN